MVNGRVRYSKVHYGWSVEVQAIIMYNRITASSIK